MFKRAKVLEYISNLDDKFSFETKYREIKNDENLSIKPEEVSTNDISRLVDSFPVGTILAKNYSNGEDFYIICFPFFSSHMSLPLKPGEMVWYFSDNFDVITNKEFAINNPIQLFNTFWMSRVHGIVVNEDVNYTHHEKLGLINLESNNIEQLVKQKSRQANDRKKFKKDKEEIKKNILVPGYDDLSNSNARYNVKTVSTKNIYETKKRSDFFPSAIPRYFSKPDELTFQGSNNTIISLYHNPTVENTLSTEDKEEIYELRSVVGNIDLVSGRHFITKYTPKFDENFFVLKDKNKVNVSESDQDRKFKEIKIDKSIGYYYIENESGEIENLKDPKSFLGENNIDFSNYNSDESSLDSNRDASTIKISERRRADSYQGFVFENNEIISHIYKQKNIDLVSNEKSKDTSTPTNYNFLQASKFEIPNKTSFSLNNKAFDSKSNKKFEEQELPSVLIKTNDVRIISRKSFENTKNELEPVLSEGSIRLVKESNNFLSHAHVCLENDGNILVDGNTILLGNINKELLRQNINFETGPASFDQFKDMHGKGLGLLIGYDEMLSEPLVLGETLKNILNELITINGLLLDELKNISDNLSAHVHEAAVPGGFTMFPDSLSKSEFDSSGSKIDGDIRKRFEDVRANLVFILSRFAKTS